MNVKRNILIYLDNYPMLSALPPEQRGWVITALMVYGDRLSREGETNLEEVMEQFPLSSEARLVCGFMGANILRDTQKWLARQQYRSSAAPGKGRQGVPAPAPVPEKTFREDMSRARQILEQFQSEDK